MPSSKGASGSAPHEFQDFSDDASPEQQHANDEDDSDQNRDREIVSRKRALEIATTLALDPAMLLLDEPMAGMGHEDIGRIAELIRRVAKNRTILMVEHNLHVVADLCDRVTVLARGEILSDGSYATVSADPRVREAYMGTEHE